MDYISGELIRSLREKQHMTQGELADRLCLSDKTISKWETGRGLPEITILPALARELHVSVSELMTGSVSRNENLSGNMRRTCFYVCPVCGNVLFAAGDAAISCCGVALPKLQPRLPEEDHPIRCQIIDNEYYVSMDHPMTKEHYIRFLAFVTTDRVQLCRLYPEQDAACRFPRMGPGMVYACCSDHGLFRVKP